MTNAEYFNECAGNFEMNVECAKKRAEQMLESAIESIRAGYYEDAISYLGAANARIAAAQTNEEQAKLLRAVADKVSE